MTLVAEESTQKWLPRQLSELRNGGSGVFKKKVLRTYNRLHLRELANGIWAVPFVLLIRALRPIVLIRLGTLFSSRIGHFASDGAEQVARLQQQPPNTVDWFWLGPTSNSQWERMIRRSLPVHSWVKYLDWWNRALPGGSAHERPSSYTGSRDVEGLYARHDVKIPFLPGETTEALAWLRGKGWKDGEPFVCLLVRDSAYLANVLLDGSPEAYELTAYHDYRDSDIDTYIPAIQWLSEQGVWVIRMGKLMRKPLPTGMDHVIDYAFDAEKSDLLDIWLFANCSGCISTGTGPDMVSLAYGVPLLFVNAVPLGGFWSFARNIWVPKPLRWVTSERLLSVREQLLNSSMMGTEFEAAGISIVDLSSEDILASVQEFWQRHIGMWTDAPDDEQRQRAFHDELAQWRASHEELAQWREYSKGRHGWEHPDARAGADWLRSLEQVGDDSTHQV